ncbi:MAG: polyprenyl synthetase family protein [Alphaproteobacteria bacterium PRO2]|nr:polyprenyl synthetase family protein [Alphaproteobacteria bacterium PRO2]
MTAQAGKKQAAQPSPLDRLSDLLAGDMKSVNAEIIRRMDSPVALIPKLASYLIAAGGKRIRPLMTLASTSIFSGDMTRAHNLAAAVEFIHTATLLHDDVVDESTARRGQDSANLVFGNQASVLVGDFLFSRAFQLMVDDGSLDVLRILSDASAIIAQGEVMQLSTANNLSTGMGEYLEVIRAKTAALFAAACEVGPVVAGADAAATRAMAEYGLNLGIAFQIADDALDYAATQEKIGKTPGDDFREGKMTAPVILALMKASPGELKFWSRTLGEKQQTEQDFTEAQRLIKKHDSIAESLALANDYGEKARLALAEAPDHPIRALLDELIFYTINRDN